MNQGQVIACLPFILEGEVRVKLKVKCKEGGYIKAYLPSRELCTILPVEYILYRKMSAQYVLKKMAEILEQSVIGRKVLIKKVGQQNWAVFCPWKNVQLLQFDDERECYV